MLKKDDWTLVREQAKGQRIQALIQLEISNKIIGLANIRLKQFKGTNKDAKIPKSERPNF